MGTSVRYLIAHVDPIQINVHKTMPKAVLSAEPNAPGWVSMVFSRRLPIAKFEDLVCGWFGQNFESGIAVYLQDDDFSYLIGWDLNTVSFRTVLNPVLAHDYLEGNWALDRIQYECNMAEVSAAGLSEWSRVAPISMDLDAARQLIGRNWSPGYEGVAAVLRSVGLNTVPTGLPLSRS